MEKALGEAWGWVEIPDSFMMALQPSAARPRSPVGFRADLVEVGFKV